MDLLFEWTEDELRLPGVHYVPAKNSKDICIVSIHGMSGNILENYFDHVLGETLSNHGIGFLYGHTRGYGHINDITTKTLKEDGGYISKRIGVTYERFEECLLDIETWLEQAQKLGYKRIILLGHSLGCNKSIYYLHRNKSQDVKGLILLSPPDMVGNFKKYQPNYEDLVVEAKKNVSENQPSKILSTLIWDYYSLSSATFLDLALDGSPADNLPIMRNPDTFPELASISVPLLAVIGENDDITINSLEDDMNLLKAKATACPSFTKGVIKGANHNYVRQEEILANTILEWAQDFSTNS